ncbi:hypothetical protein CBR_g54061 [Chara braunii]|uniref:Reverse transcriptase domain-containing protein n=1 Tax=Chara braunii TaxID=69332 RepID=A0A388MBT4_CHABU|nr:hypothetical protein CBR_g54061 [Chara braunii]|eukprot:GBG91965.1 hypothetical protein CBR_g54061 [Chara braunii]
METGYDFILGTPWSRWFRSTEADWATNNLVLKTKCGQTYCVPFIGTTARPRPDPPPPEPFVPTPSPSITVTSPRQFALFIRQDDVTFFMVNVTDLLHYDPPCPDVELIPLEPDPPSISMAPISTSVPPRSVKSTPPSRADVDTEELARYTADLEPAVRDLIREYHDVFPSSFSYAGIPPMRDIEHSIQLVPDYRVHHQAPYTLSIPEVTELKRQLEELLRLGFIKPSNSPWGAPVLFARKADGTLRLCIDYRGLNRYTVKNSYPMPRSDELFDRLAGNRFFTKIDLRSGYHQIRVAAADQPKTAFRSRFGHYEFTVMPFDLTNGPATFQRAMNDIFRDILEQYILVYLNDILVYSRTLEEHLRHLHDVLDRLRRHGFYAKLSKCRFAQHKVDFLGHYVSDQGLHMDDVKITAIAEWPAPTSAKQLRSFLGLTNYYSNFIRGYARYFYVLTSTLLRKNPPWAWTPLHENAFRALKKAVTCAPREGRTTTEMSGSPLLRRAQVYTAPWLGGAAGMRGVGGGRRTTLAGKVSVVAVEGDSVRAPRGGMTVQAASQTPTPTQNSCALLCGKDTARRDEALREVLLRDHGGRRTSVTGATACPGKGGKDELEALNHKESRVLQVVVDGLAEVEVGAMVTLW